MKYGIVPIFTKLSVYKRHYVTFASHDPGSYSPASDRGDLVSVPIRCLWKLWWRSNTGAGFCRSTAVL